MPCREEVRQEEKHNTVIKLLYILVCCTGITMLTAMETRYIQIVIWEKKKARWWL